MMKRLRVAVSLALLLGMLAGCGAGGDKNSESPNNGAQGEQGSEVDQNTDGEQGQQPDGNADKGSDEGTDDKEGAGNEGNGDSETDSEADADEGTGADKEAGSDAGEGSTNDGDADAGVTTQMDALVMAIQEQIAEDLKAAGVEDALQDGNLSGYIKTDLKNTSEDNPQAAIFAEKLELNLDHLEAGFVIGAMFNVNADEIIVMQATEEAHVDELEAALEKELEAQDATWSKYLPDQYEKVKNNIIKTSGNFLIYITYENPEQIETVFDQVVVK